MYAEIDRDSPGGIRNVESRDVPQLGFKVDTF
jgi:hypothetical protein